MMRLEPKLRHQGIFIAGVLVLFQGLFVLVLILCMQQLDYLADRERHCREMIATCGEVSKELLTSSMKVAGLLLGPVSRSLVDLSALSADIPGSSNVIERLRSLPEKNSREQALSTSISALLQKTRNLCARRLEGSIASDQHWMREDTMLLIRYTARLGQKLNELITLETETLQEETSRRLQFRSWIQLVLFGGLGSGTSLAFLLVWKFNRTTASRLQVLLDNTSCIAEDKALMPPLNGTDELAHLDQSFRTMAARIEQSKLALQESEGQLRAILDNMLVGVVITDRHGIIIDANPGAREILAVHRDQLVASAIQDYITDLPAADLSQMIETEPGKLRQSRLAARHDERGKYIEFACSIVNTSKERLIIFNIVDISERQAAENFKRELVAMATHDLRSPLMAIQTFLNLVAAGSYGGSEKLISRAQIADDSATRLIGLVNDWLDIDKLEAGRFDVNKRICETQALIQRALNSVTALAESKNVTLSASQYSVSILADEEMIIRVLVNLLSNAINYAPRCSTVSLDIESDACSVHIHVKDSGPGIPQQYQNSIFDRFFQIDKKKGTSGLGLPICKRIVEAHGGSIQVRSAPAQGSTFSVSLPLLAKKDPEQSYGNSTA